MNVKDAVFCNSCTLAIIGYIDLKSYKIPNSLILGWLTFIVFNSMMYDKPLSMVAIIASLVTVGIYYPLRHLVKCSAGDFKLFAVLMLAFGLEDALIICFLSMLICFIPLASGIKKVSIGTTTFFAYITFLLFKMGAVI